MDEPAKLQEALNKLGANIPVTGILDGATANAVKAFQKQNGLPQDGVAGRDTRKKIVDLLAAMDELR